MGKASSSKKVQRAAQAAEASRGGGERRERGFPLLVGVLILLGVGLVLAARGTRDPAVAPLLTDHWHAAIEIYDCGTVQPTLQTQTDPDGIHTHGDSMAHIHPFNSSATGEDARLTVFFEAADVRISDTTINAPDFPTIDGTSGCDGADSVLKVARWVVDGPSGIELETVYTSDFGEIRFLQNREAFTIAKVPVGEDPPPPSDSVLAQLDSSTGVGNPESEPSQDPGPAGDGEEPADGAPDSSVPAGDGAEDG